MNEDIFIKKIDEKIENLLESDAYIFARLYDSSGLDKGKRLRARLFSSFCSKIGEREIILAAAIELLHAATLIHDDVVDGTDLRRGKSVLYKGFGVTESILYGDYLFCGAFKLISTLKDPVITCEMINALSKVLKGEILEQAKRGDVSLTRKDYFKIIRMKSGCLFAVSAKIAAMNGSPINCEPEKAYILGEDLGEVYQLVDDYMDYFGEDAEKGKFNDLKASIMTLPLLNLLEKCLHSEKEIIITVLGHQNKDVKDIKSIIRLMDKYNIKLELIDEINGFYEKVEDLFKELSAKGKCSGSGVISWIGERIKNAKKEHCDSRRGFCRDLCR